MREKWAIYGEFYTQKMAKIHPSNTGIQAVSIPESIFKINIGIPEFDIGIGSPIDILKKNKHFSSM